MRIKLYWNQSLFLKIKFYSFCQNFFLLKKISSIAVKIYYVESKLAIPSYDNAAANLKNDSKVVDLKKCFTIKTRNLETLLLHNTLFKSSIFLIW